MADHATWTAALRQLQTMHDALPSIRLPLPLIDAAGGLEAAIILYDVLRLPQDPALPPRDAPCTHEGAPGWRRVELAYWHAAYGFRKPALHKAIYRLGACGLLTVGLCGTLRQRTLHIQLPPALAVLREAEP